MLEPAEGHRALRAERMRLRVQLDGTQAGDVFLIDGEPYAGGGGYLNALVDMGQGKERQVVVSVRRDGEEVARSARDVALEPAPPTEVPEWARISREQLLEARRLGVPVAFENALGMRFVLVPGGTFEMGSSEGDPYHSPMERRSRVTLTHATYVQATHVTNAQLRRWRPKHAMVPMMDEPRDGDDHPAGGLTHAEAAAFAAWVGEQDPAHPYALPSEAELERAVRAGTRGTYWWGDDPLLMGQHENVADRSTLARFKGWDGYAEVDDGHAGNTPVAAFVPNAWGIFDPVGNIMTWCADDLRWESGLPPLPESAVDPLVSGAGKVRAVRGCAWSSAAPPSRCRSAARGGYTAEGRDPSTEKDRLEWIGMRLISRVEAPPRPGSSGDPVLLLVESPAEGELALEGQWLRVRARVEGWREGDEVRVDGEQRATLEGWLNVLVKAGKPGTQPVSITVARAGAEQARAERRVVVEVLPRPEVPEWARISREQLHEARRFGVPVAFENPLGMRFLLVPAGTFEIGSPAWEPGRSGSERLSRVTLTKPFYMQDTEVTLAQLKRWRPQHARVAGRRDARPARPPCHRAHAHRRAGVRRLGRRAGSRAPLRAALGGPVGARDAGRNAGTILVGRRLLAGGRLRESLRPLHAAALPQLEGRCVDRRRHRRLRQRGTVRAQRLRALRPRRQYLGVVRRRPRRPRGKSAFPGRAARSSPVVPGRDAGDARQRLEREPGGPLGSIRRAGVLRAGRDRSRQRAANAGLLRAAARRARGHRSRRARRTLTVEGEMPRRATAHPLRARLVSRFTVPALSGSRVVRRERFISGARLARAPTNSVRTGPPRYPLVRLAGSSRVRVDLRAPPAPPCRARLGQPPSSPPRLAPLRRPPAASPVGASAPGDAA
jgi:formylglycine-generating enzyme required for sulfatase activity